MHYIGGHSALYREGILYYIGGHYALYRETFCII